MKVDGPARPDGSAPLPQDAPRPTAGRTPDIQAAQAFEGVFVSMLVAEMRKTLPGGGFFGEMPGSEIFDGMFDELIGEEIAKQGGFGLGAFVEESLKQRLQEDQAASAKADLGRAGDLPARSS